MCWYHVTFHLNLELEHTLDVGCSGDNRVQVWSRSCHLPIVAREGLYLLYFLLSQDALLTLILSLLSADTWNSLCLLKTRLHSNENISQWRRRLECVVQQQGGHIEQFYSFVFSYTFLTIRREVAGSIFPNIFRANIM